MPDTLTVASSAPMALRIHPIDPEAEPDKRGLATSEEFAVINGTGHPDAIGGLGITHNVDAGMFANWLKVHPHLESVLRAMTPDEFKAHADAPMQSGFEPGLAAMNDDKDNAALAARGTDAAEPGADDAGAADVAGDDAATGTGRRGRGRASAEPPVA
jgi:hypothetical protein